MMEINWTKLIITIVAILGIVYLEGLAIMAGINGTLFATVIAAIAGLGGYTIGIKKETLKKAVNELINGDENSGV